MTAIIRQPDTLEKLELLSQDSQYDLACACGTKDQSTHRQRGKDNRWIYPVSLPQGGKVPILKTLQSNSCSSDCAYCPLRSDQDSRRCTLNPKEVADVFLDYLRRKEVWGLFLSSGIRGNPDQAMEKMLQSVRILRHQEKFRGYIHLKIIPGASDAAIEEAVSLANNVSINIETAGEDNFKQLSQKKDYLKDIIAPLKLIAKLTDKEGPYRKVKQTTQFLVGASQEKDAEILKYMGGMYSKLNMQRIYFSAYQRGLGQTHLPGENSVQSNGDLLIREHRLYQSDFLMRQYGFRSDEIPTDTMGNLDLSKDPKELWAIKNRDLFPFNINTVSKHQLLRVPGLGPTLVKRILDFRKGQRIRNLDQVIKSPYYIKRASPWVCV